MNRFDRVLIASSLPARAVVLAALCLLAACGPRGGSREEGLEWKADPLRVFARVEAPPEEVLRAEGFAAFAARRLLKTGPAGDLDTLRLLEFAREADAYAAFQDLAAHPADFAEGFAERGERVYFVRGRWIGALRAWSWNGPGWLQDGLALPGAPAGSPAPPPEFASLVRQKRIEGSERILTREFAGQRLSAPVYAARYHCHGDTAWIYASAGLGRGFGLELARRAGWNADSSDGALEIFAPPGGGGPFRLRFSDRGMAAVEGCFDLDLTAYWIKMQERAIKTLK